ncbi:MAG: hypothetical protein ACSLE8_06350 [Rhodococcus sp. (in: high G+C Gram-positive bacteria)]
MIPTVLMITGAAGAGKTTALQCMQRSLGGEYILASRGGVVGAKTKLVLLAKGTDRLYVDIEGQPTPSFLAFVQSQAVKKGVRHLVIAHS